LYKKLLITASLRADGSTKLGVNDKYGFSSSWFRDINYLRIKRIRNLKLRANYGITGNQEFAVNSAVARAHTEIMDL
jgi:iron complex outermembrane receptor protein